MRIAFSAPSALYRWAWTAGLEAHHQLDVTVPLSWPVGSPYDEEIEPLLRTIADSVTLHGRRFRQGDTFDYGWTTLCFQPGAATGDSAGRLVVSELTEPLLATPPMYSPGVERLAKLMRTQAAALRRNRIEGAPVYPHRSELAVICTRVPPVSPTYPRPLVLERRTTPADGESGWVIRCADVAHHHDHPAALAHVALLHVIPGLPAIVPYLALPVGSAVLLETQAAIVFRPGEDDGTPDPAPALRWTLAGDGG